MFPTVAGADMMAKWVRQSLRTTTSSTYGKGQAMALRRALEKPIVAYHSHLIQAEWKQIFMPVIERHRIQGLSYVCGLVFPLFFFFFFQLLFLQMPFYFWNGFFGLLVGWMDWVIAQYLGYFVQAELSCYWEDIDKLKAVEKRAPCWVRGQKDWTTRKVAES